MEEKLIEYADQIIEALKAGIDFASEQAPLLIQEVLQYYAFYHGVLFGLFVFLVLLCFIFSIGLFKNKWNTDDWSFGFMPLILSIFPFIGVFTNGFILYKIIYSPRLFLIGRLTELL